MLFYRARARFSNAASDLFTDLKVYDECARLRSESKHHSTVKSFCEMVRRTNV